MYYLTVELTLAYFGLQFVNSIDELEEILWSCHV